MLSYFRRRDCHVCCTLPFRTSAFRISTADFLSFHQQIACWLKRQHAKARSTKIREANPEDPITILMARLTSTNLAKPRAPPPYNLWARLPENKALVDEEYKLAHPQGGVVDLNLLRSIKSRLYEEAVPLLERTSWRKQALAEGKVLVEDWERGLVSPPAMDPESRQRFVLFSPPFNLLVLTSFQLYQCDYRNYRAIPGSHMRAYRHGWICPIRRARTSGRWTAEHCQVGFTTP